MKSKTRLHADAHGNIVDENDPAAAELVAAEGHMVPERFHDAVRRHEEKSESSDESDDADDTAESGDAVLGEETTGRRGRRGR